MKKIITCIYIFVLAWHASLVLYLYQQSTVKNRIVEAIDFAVARFPLFLQNDVSKKMVMGYRDGDGTYYIYNHEVTWKNAPAIPGKPTFSDMLLDNIIISPSDCVQISTCTAKERYIVNSTPSPTSL